MFVKFLIQTENFNAVWEGWEDFGCLTLTFTWSPWGSVVFQFVIPLCSLWKRFDRPKTLQTHLSQAMNKKGPRNEKNNYIEYGPSEWEFAPK